MVREMKQQMIEHCEKVVEAVRPTMTSEPDLFWTIHRGLYYINHALRAIEEIKVVNDIDALLDIQSEYEDIFSYKVNGE